MVWPKINNPLTTDNQVFRGDYLNALSDLLNGTSQGFGKIPNSALEASLRTAFDYYIFIDTDDGNKYKARNGRTGAIYSSHATDASIVFQAVFDDLDNNSQIVQTSNVSNFGYNMRWGGKYGTIYVGPGRFFFYKAATYGSYIKVIGSGCMATRIEFPDNLYPGVNNNTLDLFKSKHWDQGSISTTGVVGEIDVAFRDIHLYGNYLHNQIPNVNTATTTGLGTTQSPEVAGTDSWGHGIAHFGGLLYIDNMIVHGMPGAGIIIQGGTGAGGGWGYPINSFTNLGGNPGVEWDNSSSVINNTQCYSNGRQGILVRSPVYITNHWSWWNGEAGIDEQTCDYFNGSSSWINGVEVFENGWQHGGQAAPQVTTYDPLGFNMRLIGGWISNSWIEPSFGNGDNLMIGANGLYNSGGGTGWQIKTHGAIMGSNIIFDTPRASCITIGGANSGATLKSVVLAYNGGNQNSTPLLLLAGGCDIDMSMINWNQAQVTSPGMIDGIIIGDASHNVACTGNRLRILSFNNDYVIDNQNAGNYNDIEITLVNTAYASIKQVLKPGGQALDYTRNTISVNNAGNWQSNSNQARSHNGGTATLTNPSTTATVAHLLFDVPSVVETRAKNSTAAAGPTYYMTADATNITFNFVSAPPAGTYTFWWNARVVP